MAKIVADQRARGGTRGRPVLIVLGASFILLAIYLVSLLAWSGSQTPTSPSQATSQQSQTSPSTSNTNKIPADNPAYPAQAAPSTGGQGTAPANR